MKDKKITIKREVYEAMPYNQWKKKQRTLIPTIPDKPFDLYERLKEASKRFKKEDEKKPKIDL